MLIECNCLQSNFVRHNTPHPRDLKARAEKLFGKGGRTSDGPLMTAGELTVSSMNVE